MRAVGSIEEPNQQQNAHLMHLELLFISICILRYMCLKKKNYLIKAELFILSLIPFSEQATSKLKLDWLCAAV